MPIRKLQGLRGLKGLNTLSPEERDAFMEANSSKLDIYRNPMKRRQAANILYMNQRFINKYGLQRFNEMNDGSEDSFDFRNQFYKDDIINTEFDKFGTLFENSRDPNLYKARQLSADAKLKLMESDYLTPTEFEDSWKKRMKESTVGSSNGSPGFGGPVSSSAGLSLIRNIASLTNAISKGRGLSEAVGLFTPGGEEAAKKVAQEKNQRIFDDIFNEDADNAAKKYSTEVAQAYQELIGLGDDAIKKAFIQAITPDSYKDKNGMSNLGIPDYKKYFGDGSENERSSLMSDFSIDDMRQVLAKKKVYDANMSPDMAATALNNDAKRYAYDHEGFFRRMGLFAKDVGISTLSYTADKVNGFYNLALEAQDKLQGKPIVLVDDRGNVLDPNKTKLIKDRRGNLSYRGEDGNMHYVHREQIDRTTLHNMGRNFDGSEDEGILNPQYWTRAEQFGTLDSDEQKQYERLGASPYKVAYNPNEDSDLWYESFKMMSFGIADAASQLLPYGVGLFGKSLSAASKANKVIQGLGKALGTTGKMLTFETKAGQIAQGTSGALGIAYAYNRGAFQETLAQNLANTDEAILNASKNDIFNQYNSDKNYKAGVDKLINARAASMKADYIAQMRRDGGMRIADMKAVDKMLHAKAQDAVLGELVQQRVNERKSSKDYADLQQKAIQSAGDAAMNTFLTEGLKYGLVNNLGYRKFLYTNPAGLSRKVSTSLKGLKEITTESGKKRMATEGSKFLTRGQKLKEFGKTLGSQVWGGAWTNGTDDMQVDAAERINNDSFNRYLDAYQSGKAMASTYGFADSLYSYVKGLQNSLGQSTTWNSAAVGGLGSLASVTPNMANIVRLTTKEGREAWRNNFGKQVERDKNGMPIKNEDGTLKYKDLTWKDNWRERVNYLLQNGVLNTYYGKKQSERDLQNHADFVNNLLDEYKDFEDIEHLVASNIASENIANDGDAKTIQYLKALQAINTLNNLGNNSKDPATMSSVVQDAKALIDKMARFNDESNDGSLSEEQISNILSQYYAANPGLEQSEENNLKALEIIGRNAKKLQEASKAFEDGGKEIAKIERNKGITIDPDVKLQLMLQKALVNHWQERKQKMQSEIGDSSSDDVSMDANTYIASVGGRKNAQILVKTYNRQQKELEKDLTDVQKKIEKQQKELDKATKEYKEAYAHGTWGTTDEATTNAENTMKDAQAQMDNLKMQEDYIQGMIARTANKRKSLEMDMSNMNLDETTRRVALAQEELTKYQNKLNALREQRKKYVNKKGERDKRYSPEKLADIDKSIADYERNVASRKETLERNKEKVLTADEIFALDPVTRARMMNKNNRSLYSKEQQEEIRKLEQKLMIKDADAPQKVQDIALLTQRINTNEDAYNRVASNPLAASKAFEEQRYSASQEATGLLNQQYAENIANVIRMYDIASKLEGGEVEGIPMETFAYNRLRQLNHQLLDIIDEDKLLPEYQTELNKAKEWRKVIEDIDAVISNSDRSKEWKDNIDKNIANMLNSIDSKDDIIPTLEKAIDDLGDSDASKDVDYILEGLKKQGYSRDATAVENRKQRKEREEADRKKKEEEQKKAEDEAKNAAEKKTEENSKTEDKKEKDDIDVPANGKGIIMDEPTGGDMGKVPSKDDDFSLEDEGAVDFDEGDLPKITEKNEKEESKDKSEETNVKPQPQAVEEEDLHQIPDGVLNAQKLFDDDFKNQPISFKMWHDNNGSPEEGEFLATRTDGTDTKTASTFDPSKVNMGFKAGGNGMLAKIPLDSEEAMYNGYEEDGKVKVGITSTKTKSSAAFPSMFDKKGDSEGATAFTVTKPAIYNKVEQNDQTYYKLESKGEIYFGESKQGNTKSNDKISFTIDGNKETLNIEPNEYDVVTDEQENKKNDAFIANSIEKKDGDWYFIGNFAGDKQSSEVKVKNNFDLDKAIERQQAAREAELGAKGVDVKDNNIIDNGDTVQAKSESIDEQAKEVTSNSKEIVVADNNIDVSNENTLGQQKSESSSYTLSGNAMSRYDMTPLVDEGKIVLKKGNSKNDHMNEHYAWMKAAGINLQNIIDHELALIIQRNPHAKVKFVMISHKYNATNDGALERDLPLVLDYDDKINKGITSIHNDANGSVIEANGKKYLIIGMAGFSNEAQRKLWFRIHNKNTSEWTASPTREKGLIVPNRAKYVKEHPEERFYVDEQYTTEIVPHSLIPGYIVKQGLNDEHSQLRSVKELLADKDRNPFNLTMSNVAWGIQETTQFMLVGTTLDKVMVPRNPFRNTGSAFVLMPASNGKMVPSYLRPLMYNEMKDGVLKDRIDNLLQEVVAPTYERRVRAVSELGKIFYLDKDGNNILIGKDNGRHRNEVSLVRGDEILKTFVLDSNFDRGEFMKGIYDLNPRINITAHVLTSNKLLDEYSEAGALSTDAALFGTAGSSYSIYALGTDGKMLMPEHTVNSVPKIDNSDFRNEKWQQVPFMGDYYKWSDGTFYLDGKAITDDSKIKQLQYNKDIIDNGMVPDEFQGVWDFYIISTGEQPLAIKVHKNSKEVKELGEKQSKELIKRIEEREAKKVREKEAMDAMELPDGVKEGTLPEMISNLRRTNDVSLEDNGMMYDEETGGFMQDNPVEEPTMRVKDTSTSATVNPSDAGTTSKVKSDSTSLPDYLSNRSNRRKITQLIGRKWKVNLGNIADIEKFLRDKNVEVDSIGTSKADIEAWMKTIEDCR